MAFSLNRIMLIGNLGQDAETRFTTSNLSVTSFSIATIRSYKKDNDWVNETTWHNIVAFNLPDFYKDQLKKGKKFYVEGRLSKRDYTDKEGVKRYVTEVVSEQLIPLDSSGQKQSPSYNTEESGPAQSYGEPEQASGSDNDLPF